MPFTTEEITGCTNEAAKGANKANKSAFLFFYFMLCTVPVIPSINIFEFSSDFMI